MSRNIYKLQYCVYAATKASDPGERHKFVANGEGTLKLRPPQQVAR